MTLPVDVALARLFEVVAGLRDAAVDDCEQLALRRFEFGDVPILLRMQL
jgi:hypothetical protein